MRVIEGLGEFLQGLLARGPAQQSKLAELLDRVIEIRVGAFDRLVRLADLLPARGASVRVGRGPVRPDRVQHHLLDPVGPGARVPVDAEVIQGESEVDESSVTGESMPVHKGPGDKLVGGTINKNGTMRGRAVAVGSDTALAQIVKLV